MTWHIVIVQVHVVLQGRHVLGWVMYVKGFLFLPCSPTSPQVVYLGGMLSMYNITSLNIIGTYHNFIICTINLKTTVTVIL